MKEKPWSPRFGLEQGQGVLGIIASGNDPLGDRPGGRRGSKSLVMLGPLLLANSNEIFRDGRERVSTGERHQYTLTA
jgi:hypothetical protein